jgi:hypothetical protein
MPILIMAAGLILGAWLLVKPPKITRWFSRRAEIEDANPDRPPLSKIKHRRYRFDDQGRIIGHDDD